VQVKNYDNGLLHVEPVVAPGDTNRCVVTVPLDKLDEFITALKTARGVRIGDKVRTLVEMKATHRLVRWAGDVRTVTLHAGHEGQLVDRMDDGQFVFDAMHGIIAVRSYVSPNEVERV
jgi:hypothetical protein